MSAANELPELSVTEAERVFADEAGQAEKQMAGRIFGAEIVGGQVRYVPVRDMPNAAVDADDELIGVATPSFEPGGISPGLLRDVEQAEKHALADTMVEVLVSFKDRVRLPRFPALNEDEASDSPRNADVRRRSESLASAIRATRAKTYDARRATFEERYGLIELERFWLIDAVLATMPLGRVRALAGDPEVGYVEYRQGGARPPEYKIADGVALMRAELYYGFTGGGSISMLDTGIRSTHIHFNSPNRIGVAKDCTQGTSNTCTGPSPGDCTLGDGHGTCSASIMVGNDRLGLDYRGVSQLTLNSYRVYDNQFCGYDAAAGARAFQATLVAGSKVILANIQEISAHDSATSLAANAAFDVGSVVIAPAGNILAGAQPGSVKSPGNAKRVLAIGAIHVQTQVLQSYSGRGPTADGRTKPDLTAPTYVHTASAGGDTWTGDVFGGTSAAAPFATGAAAVTRNFLRGVNATIDPGVVYAYLLMGGRNTNAPATSNTIGAGLIRLYNSDTQANWGFVNVTNGQSQELTFPVNSWPAGNNFWEAAIWWPELNSHHHNVDLRLVKPNGSIAASSLSTGGVWEKVYYLHAAMSTGTWKLRISGTSVSAGVTQKVFYAIRRSF